MNSRVRIPAFDLDLAVSDRGAGPAWLLLHSGAGRHSIDGLATALADRGRAILPAHPGFDGTPRPEGFSRVAQIAQAYAALLDEVDAEDVIAVGNSIGGWIALEMALLRPTRLKGVAALNSVGVDPGPDLPPIVDPARVPPAELPKLAFHDPDRFALAPPTAQAAEALAANQRMVRVYGGEPFMYDPGLPTRLADMAIPSLFVWGESDRTIGVEYGRRFAAMIPGARFETVARAGHFPHIERLDATLDLLADFRRNLG